MFRIINNKEEYLHKTKPLGQTICLHDVYIFGNERGYHHSPYIAKTYSEALTVMTHLHHKEPMKIVEN